MDKNILKRIFKYIFMGIPQYNIKVEVKPNCTGKQMLDKTLLLQVEVRALALLLQRSALMRVLM